MARVTNPVLPGFHPDPSWVRVDGWTYLVTSTFAWLPGLPVVRTRDFITWEALPPVIDAAALPDLRDHGCDDGLYAPGLRHDGRRFILACTVVHRSRQRFRNFLCTSEDPTRGWSAPVWLPEDMGRIDPTPFIDDDGSLWLVLNDRPSTDGHHGANREIRLWRLDPATLQPVEGPWVLWHGALVGVSTPEAPRLFRRDGWYWLLIAEGGTGANHAVTMARSRVITGPYEGCPANPLLTHRHLGPGAPVQCVGHADLIAHEDDSWWAACLAERWSVGHRWLGRETWILPVAWPPGDGWPVFAPGEGRLPAAVTVPGPERAPSPVEDGWIGLRGHPGLIAAELGPDRGRLPARTDHWDEPAGIPALVARRLTAHAGRWEMTLEREGAATAVLLLFTSDRRWIALRWDGAEVVLVDAAGREHGRAPCTAAGAVMALAWDDQGIHARVDGDPLGTAPVAALEGPVFAGAVAAVVALGPSGAVVFTVRDRSGTG